MNEENVKDARIGVELKNSAYDIVNEAIMYTMQKYNYKEYDLVKLVMMIYDGNYSYLSNDYEYREQFKLLNEYFKREYNHDVITFEMIRAITSVKDKVLYNDLTAEIAYIETILRSNKKEGPRDLSIFSYPIKNKKYDDLMYLIEKNISMKYAVAIIYDKIKFNKIVLN